MSTLKFVFLLYKQLFAVNLW